VLIAEPKALKMAVSESCVRARVELRVRERERERESVYWELWWVARYGQPTPCFDYITFHPCTD
jgi:hypothetical protein